MNIGTRAALLIALAAGLSAPTVLAQSAQDAQGSTRAIHRFTDLQASAAAQSSERISDALLNTNAPISADSPPPVQRLNETAPPPMEEVEERAMQPVKPPGTAKPASEATGESASTFSQIDSNGDGRISAAEGEAVADFKATFERMDADRDGFVTETEFRADSKAEREKSEEKDRKDN